MINEQIQSFPLDISLSTVECFRHFSHLPYAILLDSAEAPHQNGQFDIIVAWPLHQLESLNGRYRLDNQPISCIQNSMQTLLDAFNSTKHPSLPFTGGWVGFISYDFGRQLEHMPTLAEHDIELPEFAMGFYPDALIFDRSKQRWFYVCQPEHNRLDNYLEQLEHQEDVNLFELTSDWTSNLTVSDYANRFARIQDYLKSGDCYQINLAQRFSASFEGDAFVAYGKLRDSNKAPFSAFINHPLGQILSVSPERFIQVNDRRVETKPIKGTLPRGQSQEEDLQLANQLQTSPKDRAENVMIVDLLRNDLGKVAKPGTVNVPSLFAIESFPAVHHLVSTVTSQLAEGKTAIDQFFAAFPGGSITGAPKIRAMEIIEELEPHRRSIYCGSIGYMSACGKMDTSITIRTLVTQQNKLYCWAGGGIVADSICENEYQETLHKVNKILPLLSN